MKNVSVKTNLVVIVVIVVPNIVVVNSLSI